MWMTRGLATLNGGISATGSGPQVAFLKAEPRAARPTKMPLPARDELPRRTLQIQDRIILEFRGMDRAHTTFLMWPPFTEAKVDRENWECDLPYAALNNFSCPEDGCSPKQHRPASVD